MNDFDTILHVDTSVTSQRKVFPKRKARIEEAKSWAIGVDGKRLYHQIWSSGDYAIALGKPGKESLPGYSGKINPNDMRPTIFLRGADMQKAATFQDIVKDLELVGKTHHYALELLGCLLFRSAFLLDHKIDSSSSNKEIYRYYPDKSVIEKITETVPFIYGVPTEVFVHYLDAIALNEDVKYDFLEYDLQTKNVGGRNNMLTYVNLIAVISGKKALYTLTGPLLRSGVAAITQKAAFDSLPHISKTKKDDVVSPYAGKFIDLPLYESVGCGELMVANTLSEEMIKVRKEYISSGSKYFVLRVTGDSMDKASINDGDLVLCRKDYHPVDGNKVVALIGDDATIKEYHHEGDHVVLKPCSTNSIHQPLVFTDNEEMKVQGIVVRVIKEEE